MCEFGIRERVWPFARRLFERWLGRPLCRSFRRPAHKNFTNVTVIRISAFLGFLWMAASTAVFPNESKRTKFHKTESRLKISHCTLEMSHARRNHLCRTYAAQTDRFFSTLATGFQKDYFSLIRRDESVALLGGGKANKEIISSRPTKL